MTHSYDDLVLAHRELCARAARRFVRPGLERADLEQVAAIGLIKSARKFNASNGVPFAAYAWRHILGELLHFVRAHERAIRLPRSLWELDRRYDAAVDRLAERFSSPPRPADVAAELGTTTQRIEEVCAARAARLQTSATTPDDERRRFRREESVHAPEDRIVAWSMLRGALETLPARERTLLLATYGLGIPQHQTAKRLRVSARHASRLRSAALAKMRTALEPDRRTGERGFTLVELMIVVAIIAIIAGILVPNFFHARAQAATAACQQNLRAIATAAELVYTTTRAYPAGSGVAVDTSFGSTGTGGFKGQYLSQTPVDPAQSTGGAAAYLYTLNAAVNGRESYTIVCPGVHDASTLAGIAGETGTQSSLTYSSDTGIGVK